MPDIYTRTAAAISNIPVATVDKKIRQRGKVTELALGFGGAVNALQAMAAGYGMHISDEDAKIIVNRWREANPWCVKFWGRHDDMNGSYGLWGALNKAIERPGETFSAGRISYTYVANYLGGSLLCILPSGRCLVYRDIRYERVAELDDDDNIVDYAVKLRFSRGYGRVNLWHGMACENVVQAVAADILRGTLRRLEERASPPPGMAYSEACVRLHTHDEILVEVEDEDAATASALLRDVMRCGFDWSGGLPLVSEETTAFYYTKHKEGHG